MKKLFHFKSSSSHGSEHHEISTATRDKGHTAEMRWKTARSEDVENRFQNPRNFFPVSERKVTERKTISRTRSLTLRRSRSLSMSDDKSRLPEDVTELRNQIIFPSSRTGVAPPSCDCSDCRFGFNDRGSKPAGCNVPIIQIPGDHEFLNDRTCSGPSYSSSPRKSFGSNPVPGGEVLDLYIDGENHQDLKFGISNRRARNPTGSSSSSSILFFPSHGGSRDSLRSDIRPESPRKLAKDVVERLLRLEQFSEAKKPKNVSPNWSPMPTTSCDKHLDGHGYSPEDGDSRKGSPSKDINEKYTLALERRDPFLEKDDSDSELGRKLEEAKERAKLLSMELARERSQKVRNLLEEERNFVLEISDQIQSRIAERAAAKQAVSSVKEEMKSMIVKLERQKDDWKFKLREFQSEENMLRNRIRELADHNASLQKEVSSFHSKEEYYTDRLSYMEVELKELTSKMDVTRSENDSLQKKLSEVHGQMKAAEEAQSCLETSYKEKEKENTGLVKAVARLQGTCSEQERTIDGLRQCLNIEIEKRQSSSKVENLTQNLQMEQLRLSGVEQVLRRQLENCKVESESLRHENIYLLERLQATGKVSGLSGTSGLKLEQELVSCVQVLQNKGLSLVDESIRMSAKLLGILRSKSKSKGFLEEHTLIEYDMKVQGFKQGVEQLTRSLGKAASVLNEKTKPANYELISSDKENDRFQDMTSMISEDDLKSELKAEILLTGILKDKLYSKETEIERLQNELARAVRNHDVIKSEMQNAFDTVSCVNHKMKNLELQIIKKDGTINQLQSEVRLHGEELSNTRGILSKVTQERDMMWEEVKQYSEKNMLLNREVNSMKKKIEALEEDTLLKDGQISILKDSLSNARSFDVLFGSEHGDSFKL